MKNTILAIGTFALLTAVVSLSWAERLNYGTNLDSIVSGNTAVASDVRGAFDAIKQAIDGCPTDMAKVGSICVDKYEASVFDSAGTQYGTAAADYPCAVNGNDCSATIKTGGANAKAIFARSLAGQTPSRYITWFQAAQACANSGKRLLTNAEWQMAAAGTTYADEMNPTVNDASGACNVNNGGTMVTTGSSTNCVSHYGAFDMVGNANEFVADWVQGDGTIAANTPANNTSYGIDRVVAGNAANQGGGANGMPAVIIRGGSSLTGATDAGEFFFISNGAPSIADNVTGFRCAS